MQKKKILIISLISILIIGCVSIFLVLFLNKKNNQDAIRFKEEYESLNNTVRESDGATYKSISISKTNPIKYININEAIEIIKKETAVIYVGANWCPYCRNAIPVLFEAAKKIKINTIYYLNLDNERSSFEVQDNKLVKTKEGSKEYYELLDILKDNLKEYTVTGPNGKVFNTNERRIYMPTIFTIKDGRVLDMHIGTVSLDDDQTKYDYLTSIQHEELLNIYKDMLAKIK